MRIVIDLQSAQTIDRDRATGRRCLRLAQAIAHNRGAHEVVIALNGLLQNTIDDVRASFDGLLPNAAIRVWHAPGPVREEAPDNDARRDVAELIREAFLASLDPDVILVGSLFEGYVDDGVTSIGRFDRDTPVCAIIDSQCAMTASVVPPAHGSRHEHHAHRKIDHLKQASLVFAFSAAAKRESLCRLGLPESGIVDLAAGMEIPLTQTENGVDVEPTDPAFWDACAMRVIDAFSVLVREQRRVKPPTAPARRPNLVLVSPLPPERSGIADYSAELLPALAAHYEIDAVVAQPRVVPPWLKRYARIRDVAWLRAQAGNIDRVLYHFGNSHYHQHMLALLREIPGVVVLHDFFLGHLIVRIDHVSANKSWANALYASHGYLALRHRHQDPESAQMAYPANLEILQRAEGVIVHSEYARGLARQWYGEHYADAWAVIPPLRAPSTDEDKAAARTRLGVGKDDFIVCSFGVLGTTKLNHILLRCWSHSALAGEGCCRLLFVGENPAGQYGTELLQAVRASDHGNRVRITGFASPEAYRDYLAATDVAVQLRAHSRGESSAAVLDCMNHALPLIVNANGALAELDPESVWLLPDAFDDSALIAVLEALWRDPERRRALGARARATVRGHHAPETCAQLYAEAIERFHHRARTSSQALLHAITGRMHPDTNDAELIELSKAVAASLPLPRPKKCLFLDITATRNIDRKTGIERVARSLLLTLLETPPSGYRIEPVYLDCAGGVWRYLYARQFTLDLLGCPPSALDDDIVEPESGDMLLTLDFSRSALIRAERAGLLSAYRNQGVSMYSVIFDLLPVRMPMVFPPGADRHHAQWLSAVSTFDGAFCISRAVAEDFAAWRRENGFDRGGRRPYRIGWFHLGSDVVRPEPSRAQPRDADALLDRFRARPSFLMVGTIEPRKGYPQVIEAFSLLWQGGIDVNLIIVGQEGWKQLPTSERRDIPQTVERLHNHPELHNRMFWLNGIDDEFKERIYAASTCLIAASYGEGFGLPLIEAASHKLCIIARDIPVFREVAGDHARYFSATSAEGLRDTIEGWLAAYSEDAVPRPDAMHCPTWKQSASSLLTNLCNE